MTRWRQVIQRLQRNAPRMHPALDEMMTYFALERAAEQAASRGDPKEALSLHHRALEVAVASGNTDLIAGCWSSIGTLHIRAKAYSEAVTAYEAALPHSRTSGNRHGLAVCLRNLAEAKRYCGKFAEALGHATEALSLYSAIGNREGIGAATRATARNLEELGEGAQALEAFRRALDLYEGLPGHAEAVATCHHRIGVLLCTIQGGTSARPYLEKALAAARAAQQAGFAVDVLNDLALSHAMDGDYQTALRLLLDVLGEARGLPDARDAVAVCLNNLGRISLQQYDNPSATRYFEEAISIGYTLVQRTRSIVPLENLARVHELAGRWGQALELHTQALDVARGASQTAFSAFCCCSVGRTLAGLGRYDEALSILAEGAALARRIGHDRQLSELLCNMAGVHLRRQDHGAAAEAAAEACRLAREHGERDTLQAFLTMLAEALIALGRRAEAKEALEEAVDLLDGLRATSAADRQAQLRAFDADVATHRLLIEHVLLPGGEIDRAFTVLERAKSRLLWDLLADRHLKQARRRGSGAAARIDQLTQRRRALEFLLGDRVPGQEAAAQQWLSEYEEIGKALREIGRPEADAGLSEQPVRFPQDIRAVLPARTALVEFFVGRSSVAAFLVGHHGECRLVPLPDCTPAQAKGWADELGRAAAGHAARDYWERLMAALDQVLPEVYDCCVREVVGRLSGDTDHVFVVPHQEFHHVPFHAAFHMVGERRVHWLEEGRTISFAPSSSLLRSCLRRERPAPARLLAVANPTRDLPATEGEVARVAELYPHTILLGAGGTASATRSEVIAEARGVHVVLCTGHGRRGDMDAAALMLADGELTIRDQYVELELPVCTLWDSDCCESGLPEIRGADDWITLSSAPLVAGAKTVWSTLWPVADAATAALKIAAYRAMVLERASPARALNKAQLAALAGRIDWFADSERKRHPVFWAPFISVGAP